MKDPLLESYSVYELIYEFFDKTEREKVRQQKIEQEDDKIEDDKIQKALDWAAEEERKEMETLSSAAKDATMNKRSEEDWMMAELKKQRGDNFGEDIDINF